MYNIEKRHCEEPKATWQSIFKDGLLPPAFARGRNDDLLMLLIRAIKLQLSSYPYGACQDQLTLQCSDDALRS